jgi:hypothetical protein
MLRALVAIVVSLVIGRAVAAAQDDNRPALSVMPFSASAGLLSADESLDLADDLASRLVETGRFRVLLRGWLPVSPDSHGATSPEALRAAARQARLDYLLFGSIAGSAKPRVAPAPVRSLRTILALTGARRPSAPCRPVPPAQAVATITARLVEVASGATVRTFVLRAPLGAAARGFPGTCSGGGGLAAVATALSPTDLERLERSNRDIAGALERLAATGGL